MKRLIFLGIGLGVLVWGIYLGRKNLTLHRYPIQINQFSMSKEEFEDYFQRINLSGEDTPRRRKEVLEQLIDKKLILQEAERRGLHKSKEFLKNLEAYYEQLLFKMMVDEKARELSSEVVVSDKEVRDRIKKLSEEGALEEPIQKLYSKIKWQVFREKQAEAFERWLESLRQKARIEIEQEAILIPEGGSLDEKE
jgi:hypothetical protein